MSFLTKNRTTAMFSAHHMFVCIEPTGQSAISVSDVKQAVASSLCYRMLKRCTMCSIARCSEVFIYDQVVRYILFISATMPFCGAVNCNMESKKNPGISFFKFPDDFSMRRTWILKMHRDCFIPTKHSRLCHHHFDKTQYERDPEFMAKYGYPNAKPKLKSDAVPTLFRYVREQEVWVEGHEAQNTCTGTLNSPPQRKGPRSAYKKRETAQVILLS